MELNEPHALFRFREGLGQLAGRIRLARAGRPLEDELLLFFEELAHRFEEVGRVVEFFGKGLGLGDDGCDSVIVNSPSYRLRVEAVPQLETSISSFVYEPVEESKRMLV